MVAVGDVARDRRTGVPVLQPLRLHLRVALPDARVAGGPRRAGLRHPGRGRALLHLRLHDGAGDEGRGEGEGALLRARSAQPHRPRRSLEGNLVGERYRSFVGLYALPNRHGMTAGELARLFNEREGFGCELTVVPCEGLRARDIAGASRAAPSSRRRRTCPPRTPRWSTRACAWARAPTSPRAAAPAGPSSSSARRGWTRSAVADALEALRLPGVRFRPCSFTPTFDKFQRPVLRGRVHPRHRPRAPSCRCAPGSPSSRPCHDAGRRALRLARRRLRVRRGRAGLRSALRHRPGAHGHRGGLAAGSARGRLRRRVDDSFLPERSPVPLYD